jgi:hypothetical protein
MFAFMAQIGPQLKWKREAGEKRDLWIASFPGAVMEFDAKTGRLLTARFFAGEKDSQELLKEVAVQEWRNVDGIALPWQFTIAYFSSKGTPTSLRRVTLLENRAVVNKDVLKAIVPPEIPPGYFVTDAITGSSYQVSKFESLIHSGSDYVRQLEKAIDEAKGGKK